MANQREMLGLGTTLWYDTTTPTGTLIVTNPYTGSLTNVSTGAAIASLVDIGIPDVEIEDVDTTNLSCTDYYMKFKPGLGNGGTFDVTAQYYYPEDVILQGLLRQQAWYNIVFSDGSGFIFQGYLKKLGGKLDMKDIIKRDLSFKVSGKVYSVV